VWQVLTGFASYDQWHPFMRIEGLAVAGTKLAVDMSAHGEHGMTFHPRVASALPGHELRRVARLGLSAIIDAEHYFVLTTNDDGTTHLEQGEHFSGALVALARGSAKRVATGRAESSPTPT